jgi:hypothetical protein
VEIERNMKRAHELRSAYHRALLLRLRAWVARRLGRASHMTVGESPPSPVRLDGRIGNPLS